MLSSLGPRLISFRASVFLFLMESQDLLFFHCFGPPSLMVLMQDLRHEVGLTVGVMTGCSLFLDPNAEANVKSVKECLNFLIQTLGLTKADLQSASAAWYAVGGC